MGHGSYYLLAIFSIYATNAQWVKPSTALPRTGYYLAPGHINDTIYLLGGFIYPYQAVQFNIQQKSFTDLGQNAFSFPLLGFAQYYTQIDHYLYMIHYSGEWFERFDLAKQELLSYWESIDINIDGDGGACLASNMQYLFVVGGYNTIDGTLNSLQVLNIESKTWLTNTSSMITPRTYHSCIVHPETNKLFAIGGSSCISDVCIYFDSVELIIIDNITNQDWIESIDKLLHSSDSMVSIIHQNHIWVIGGLYEDGSNEYIYDYVHIINGETGKISIGPSLNYSVASGSAIIVDNIVYSFGGFHDGNVTTNWQYINLTPTFDPTAIPTAQPTLHPSFLPTPNPTTNDPTTNNPTTNKPSIVTTTNDPTTDDPTNDPTINDPTINNTATNKPSTTTTSNDPTTITTKEPTKNPLNTTYPTMFISTGFITTTETYVPELLTSTATETERITEQSDNETDVLLILGIIGVIILCCVLMIIGYICYKLRKENRYELDKSNNIIPMMHVVSSIESNHHSIQQHNNYKENIKNDQIVTVKYVTNSNNIDNTNMNQQMEGRKESNIHDTHIEHDIITKGEHDIVTPRSIGVDEFIIQSNTKTIH